MCTVFIVSPLPSRETSISGDARERDGRRDREGEGTSYSFCIHVKNPADYTGIRGALFFPLLSQKRGQCARIRAPCELHSRYKRVNYTDAALYESTRHSSARLFHHIAPLAARRNTRFEEVDAAHVYTLVTAQRAYGARTRV